MSESSNYKDQVERLEAMLGEQGICEELDDSEVEHRLVLVPQPEPIRDGEIFSDPDDDEKILSVDHMVGGRLDQLLGPPLNEPFDFPKYNLQIGAEAHAGEQFCPLQELTKFPYKYVAAAYRNSVVRAYFGKGKLYERTWDFFYIYSPPALSKKAYLLLPSRQVAHFFFTINSSLGTRLAFPKNGTEIGFLMDFPGDGTPRPRYLGMSDEREMAECLKQAIPSRTYRPDGENDSSVGPTDKSLEAFNTKMELLVDSDKKKKVVVKQKKKAERFAKQKSWRDTVKRVQRYLGIRKASGNTKTSPVDSSFEWLAFDESVQETEAEVVDDVVLDVEKPPPFKTEDDVIFICLDVEAWERDHGRITEIGIATLDTADIACLAPGAGGKNWRDAIRARHFRIDEYRHLRNSAFVGGCAENFHFGSSEFISINDAGKEVSKCFEYPYSKIDIKPVATACNGLPTESRLNRNIVLVGHNIEADIKYLDMLGYHLRDIPNLREQVDTSSMYQALRREAQPRNLGIILANLDIAGWDLHNAGNDATYTLQAMVSIALRAKQEKQDKNSREQEKKTWLKETVKNAYHDAWEALQGWTSEGSDGGDPELHIPVTSKIASRIGKLLN